MRVDPMMPVGSTSKTWNPREDAQFWQRPSENEGSWSQSSHSTQWKPRLRPTRDISSVAGNASEGSAAVPRQGSVDESEGAAVKEGRSRHPRY